jgi:hypothetical protein
MLSWPDAFAIAAITAGLYGFFVLEARAPGSEAFVKILYTLQEKFPIAIVEGPFSGVPLR